MARRQPIASPDDVPIPVAAFGFEGFREWAQSDTFPDSGRIDFLAGEIEVEMSPEDLRTHGLVKTALALGLGNLITERSLGWLFIDGARITSSVARLSAEPDLVVVLRETFQTGRVTFRSWSKDKPERLTEIEGPVDLVVEVVSDSSVTKDTKSRPPLYAGAGIPELWIIDARRRELRFQIHELRQGAYVPVKPDEAGWTPSPRLGVAFQFVRQPSPFTDWDYTLERRG